MLEALNFREKTAIELKYLGNTYAEIASKIDVAPSTLADWFSAGGKLYEDYLAYSKKMNRLRDKARLAEYVELDENVAKLTTNVLRQFAQQLMADGKRLLVVDKNNTPILDENGRPTVFEFSKNLTVRDVVAAWKIQRILSGRDIKANGISEYNKEKVEEQIEAMRRIINAKTE